MASVVGYSTTLGHDVVTQVWVNGDLCGINRFDTKPGATAVVSSSCTRWVPAGISSVELVITSATNAFSDGNTYVSGSVIVM